MMAREKNIRQYEDGCQLELRNKPRLIRLVEVSSFDGVSTFVGYLKPQPSLKKNISGIIQSEVWGNIKRVHAFL